MIAVWALVFALVWVFFKPDQTPRLTNPSAKARVVTPRSELIDSEKRTINVFGKASPSVVYITSTEMTRDFFGFNVFAIPRGTGSGFIYDKDGHIVTNFHVIQPGDKWRVRLADGSEWDAGLVGSEADRDLAVLKINAPASKLSPITVGASHDLQVGQQVLAIGNPFGFDHTLTVGVVSALGREIEALTGRTIRGVIQTDAAINPGNSGGPLLDSSGRLIGVNTQIASPSGTSAGIGFAVPVDIVNDVVPDIIRYGYVRRPVLGVILVDERLVRRLGLPGALIESVSDDSGAEAAGLRGTIVDRRGRLRQLGDIVVKIDDKDVRDLNDLKDALEPHEAGDMVEVTYIRDDKIHVVPVKLQLN